MKWSNIDISFGPHDTPETELSERNLPFMVKLPIGWYKVAKTLIDNRALLNVGSLLNRRDTNRITSSIVRATQNEELIKPRVSDHRRQ
jgi:hypothetical protein